jgi:hypothetical protein
LCSIGRCCGASDLCFRSIPFLRHLSHARTHARAHTRARRWAAESLISYNELPKTVFASMGLVTCSLFTSSFVADGAFTDFDLVKVLVTASSSDG